MGRFGSEPAEEEIQRLGGRVFTALGLDEKHASYYYQTQPLVHDYLKRLSGEIAQKIHADTGIWDWQTAIGLVITIASVEASLLTVIRDSMRDDDTI